MVDSFWYKDAVFYEVYIRAFKDGNADGNGDFKGLISKLDYLQDLGVDCLWLLPMYQSPLVDDGYDISDYYKILPDYGSPSDFKTFMQAAHARGLRVIADLVMNHTSDQHSWFVQSRSSRDNPYRGYYVWSDTDQRYSQARIIFVDTQKSNWEYDPRTGQYYWHRFYAQQPDLNYDNPAVRSVMLEVMDHWLGMGLGGFRCDAVPYLYEREGTNCENLPETHAYLKEVRQHLEAHYQDKVLLAEANQWPKDVRPYFGDGDEFHMAFNFPVMPRLYMALADADRTKVMQIMQDLPAIPESCQWCTFLRNHDELTLEMVTPEEREFMWNYYAPNPRMRLNLGIRRRLAPLMGGDRRKIEVMNSMLFTLPGSPILYYGDEIGMGDDIFLKDRDGVRTPMQWDAGPNAGFSDAPLAAKPLMKEHVQVGDTGTEVGPESNRPGTTAHNCSPLLYHQPLDDPDYSYRKVNVEAQRADPDSLWHTIRHMITVRKQHRAFGWGNLTFLEPEDKAILGFARRYQEDTIIAVHNLSDHAKHTTLNLSYWKGAAVQKLLSGPGNGQETTTLPNIGDEPYPLNLTPYGYAWLKIIPAT